MLLRGDMTKRAEKWPVIGWWWHHLVTTMAEWEFGSSHRQNWKKIAKIPKAEQETAQPTAARFNNVIFYWGTAEHSPSSITGSNCDEKAWLPIQAWFLSSLRKWFPKKFLLWTLCSLQAGSHLGAHAPAHTYAPLPTCEDHISRP